MTVDVVLVPGAPALVPELAGAAAAETAQIRERALELLAEGGAGRRPVEVVGTDPGGVVLEGGSGTLRRWGVPMPVGSGNPVDPRGFPDTAAVAWWLLDCAGSHGPRRFRGVPTEGPASVAPHDLVSPEHTSRDHPPRDPGALLVVVADGPAALTPRAPIPERPDALRLDAELATWICRGGPLPDPGADAAPALGWWSRPVWQLMAELVDGARRHPGVCSAAPFGVGYHVAGWSRS